MIYATFYLLLAYEKMWIPVTSAPLTLTSPPNSESNYTIDKSDWAVIGDTPVIANLIQNGRKSEYILQVLYTTDYVILPNNYNFQIMIEVNIRNLDVSIKI